MLTNLCVRRRTQTLGVRSGGSPVDQLSKGQVRTVELLVEPEAEVVQRNLGGDARLHAGQGVRPLAIEAEGMEELVDDGFDDLACAGQPAPPNLRPGMQAGALGRADHRGAVVLMPALMMGTSLESLVD